MLFFTFISFINMPKLLELSRISQKFMELFDFYSCCDPANLRNRETGEMTDCTYTTSRIQMIVRLRSTFTKEKRESYTCCNSPARNRMSPLNFPAIFSFFIVDSQG